MKGTHLSYWGNIVEGISTLWAGLVLSWKHLFNVLKGKKYSAKVQSDNYFDQQEGVITVQYPNETIPVPDNGRYRLDNVIEDCIVCDKCAKVCPVNCIDIEPIRSATEIKKASDGSSVRLYAATFDIDMAKCMFCGLCTTVCPTECLTMTKTYDFSEFDVDKLNYSYSDLSPEQAKEKQEEFDIVQAAKKAQKEAKAKEAAKTGTVKPVIKTPATKTASTKPKIVVPKPKKAEGDDKKPTMLKPKIGGTKKEAVKPKIPSIKKPEDKDGKTSSVLKPKIGAMKPKVPGVAKTTKDENKVEKSTSALRPKIGGTKKEAVKPKTPSIKKPEGKDEKYSSALKPKVGAMKPKIPSATKPKSEDENKKNVSALKPKIGGAKKPSALKPKIKPKSDDE